MDAPIINPWIIYYIDICNNINILMVFIIILLLLSTLFLSLLISIDWEYGGKKLFLKIKKYIPLYLITTFIIIFFTVFLPSKGTLYKMIILKNITPNNISIIKSSLKESKDTIKQDLVDIIKLLDNKNEKEDKNDNK